MEELHEARKAAMGEVLGILATGMTPPDALEAMTALMETGETGDAVEFAERAEDSTLASPFVDHEGIFKQLDIIYDAVAHEKKAQRKIFFRKYNALAEDKKADPLHLEEARKNKDDIDAQCAHINLKIIKIKLVLGPPPAPAGEAAAS